MTPLDRRVFQKWLLILAAVFAIVWAVVRASVQSITIDEAFTYLYFAAKPLNIVWEPNSNNHVLNSLLMWITTHAFGASSITVRMPALLGAVLYVCVCYFLCKTITNQFSLRLPLFICLTYNPFIFDFMVAARGYSLANAFLLAAITVPVWNRVNGRPSLHISCVLASLALGLSFTANFSFGFVDGAAFLAIVTWAIQRREGESIVRIVGFCALPGLLVALLLCGYPLAHWHEGDLWWGAHSLKEMRQSLVQSSFYRLDPRFRGSRWYQVMNFLRPRLLPLLVILCFCQLVVTRLDDSWLQDDRARWLGRFGAALAGVATLSVIISWLAFRLYSLPLPLGRTGIFLVPLCTLLAGIIAAAPARSVGSQGLGRGLTAVFICLALHCLLCLRLSYFKEYEWDADVKDVYSVLARFNHTYGVADVGVTGLYVSALNYYRVLSKQETFPKFEKEVPELSVGRSIYVMSGVFWREFIDKEKLVVVYRGKFSEVVVAVKPDGPIPPTMIEP
jgi:hypothetical protein